MDLDRIIKELFKDAYEGNNISGEFSIPCFYTKVNGVSNAKDSEYPVVEIGDYDDFLNALEEYLEKAMKFYCDDYEFFDFNNKEEFVKQLIVGLLISASRNDLQNFILYVRQRTLIFDRPKMPDEDYKYGDLKFHCFLRKASYNLEAPYRFCIVVKNENDDRFTLPALTFYILGDKAYLYAVQRITKGPITGNLSRKLDRYFRKVNKGIDLEDDIAKVSPNALVALTIFNGYLKNLGIKEVVALNYMPLRYHSMEDIILDIGSEDELEKLDMNQSNITNKFMNLLNRYNYHFESDKTYYEDETDEMHLFLDGKGRNDNIINDIYKSVYKENKKR